MEKGIASQLGELLFQMEAAENGLIETETKRQPRA